MLVLLVLSVAVGGILCDDEARGYPAEFHHHEVIEVSEPSAEGYYHQTRVRPHKSGPDTLTSLGILALLKLLVVKIKTIGLAVILLLKLPVLLLILLTKLLFAIKLFKLAKLALIPLFLPLLIPLLLGPLLLLPLLLPLLLLLPIPVLGAAATTAAPAAGRRRRRQAPQLPFRPRPATFLHTLKMVLESEQCLERIACQIASHRQPYMYSSLIAWTLDKMKIYVENPRFETYVASYNKARNAGHADCAAYVCTNTGLNMF